jgi:hypothetical protein
MNCRVLYTELCVPVRTTGGIWTVEYCTTNSALFCLVRRVRCTVLYSSYSTSCSDWYAEFVVLYVTVHIPPVVLTGTQSSMYCTLQFIFHQFYESISTIWQITGTTTNAAYHNQENLWNMNCNVQYNELCVPVRTTGGIWTVTYSTPNSAYQSEQLVEYEL